MFESEAAQLGRLSALVGEDQSERQLFQRDRKSSVLAKRSRYQVHFERAGLTVPRGISLWGTIFAITFFTLLLIKLFGVISLMLPLILLLVYRIRLSVLAARRGELFERDYTAFLLSLASSIRTGLDPLMAFNQCGQLFPQHSVLALEVKKTARDIESGKSEERAFSEFASSIHHPDIGLLRAALILSRRQGSSLGACLHRLARVTRQRQSFRRKTRGAVAMQRLSAFGIAACTVVVGIIQGTANPRAIQEAWNHPTGFLALLGGLGLVLFGLGWMLHMSRRRL